jgi:hypothetical protein
MTISGAGGGKYHGRKTDWRAEKQKTLNFSPETLKFFLSRRDI